MGEATARLVHQLGADVVALDIQPPRYGFAPTIRNDLRDRGAIEQAVEEVTQARVHNFTAWPARVKLPAVDVVTVNFISQRHMINLHGAAPAARRRHRQRVLGAGMGYLFFGKQLQPFLALTDFADAQAWVRQNEQEAWFEPYSFSKMCSIVFTLRAGGDITTPTGVRVNCIAPGPTDHRHDARLCRADRRGIFRALSQTHWAQLDGGGTGLAAGIPQQ
ncbi:MAG: hypothetical protein R3E50_06570 [Halioglobus sp.]